MQVAFLGLGIMGSRMAANLLRSGQALTVWNRSPEKAGGLKTLGATLTETPADAVQGADVVFTMLANPEAVEETVLGSGGFLEAMQPGALWVDCSTVNPSFSRRMAAAAQQRQIRFLDAPVSGSKDPAEKAQLLFLVGGEASDLEQVRPLMEKMGRAVMHVGEQSMGSALKMVFNMLLAQAMLAFSEGLVLGEALGIPRERLFELLMGGPIVPGFVAGKRTKIESGDYEADFPLQWMQKDLQLAAQSGYEQGIALPSANAAKEVYMLAARHGFADEDFSAIYSFLQKQSK